MKRVLTSNLKEHAGEKVMMQGWIHRIRRLGQVTFIVLRDRAGLGQVVIEGVNGSAAQITNESVIQVEGLARLDDRAADGAELQASALEIISQPVDKWLCCAFIP